MFLPVLVVTVAGVLVIILAFLLPLAPAVPVLVVPFAIAGGIVHLLVIPLVIVDVHISFKGLLLSYIFLDYFLFNYMLIPCGLRCGKPRVC